MWITRKIKQINGKENVIIILNRAMERKMCLNTLFRGISFAKDKQSMISTTGYNVENPLGKGRKTS